MHGSSSVLPEFKDLINKYGGKMPEAMGVPEAMITKAAKMAICKVNIDTDLRMALTAKIRQVFAEKPGEFDPRKYLGPVATPSAKWCASCMCSAVPEGGRVPVALSRHDPLGQGRPLCYNVSCREKSLASGFLYR
jgi:fructose/tagatose bisphosphate aldolase